MIEYVRRSVAVIALLFIVVFAMQNLTSMEVSFLIWSTSVSKIVVILGSYVLGMLTGWGLFDLFKRFFKSTRKSTPAPAPAPTPAKD